MGALTETVVVHTPAGPVAGRRTGRVDRFLGIPYAEPPTGVRRFAAPVRRGRFPEPFDASRHGATSQRVPLFATTTIPEPSIAGDDILNLSVVAPATAPSDDHAPFPVVVWIHGGGFLAGSPASPWYDGRAFARDGVVGVTVGYRLGVDGFAPLDDVPTNLGLRDLLLALGWVRENIAAFGGDPGRVTLAGQSAGGAAVLALLSSPAGAGLFQRAVSVSGGLFDGGGDGDADAARDFVERLGKRLGVPPTRAGFGSRSVERIQGAVLALWGELDADTPPLRPVTGDDILPVSVADGLAGHGHGVPLLLGATGDEFDCDAVPEDPRPRPCRHIPACPATPCTLPHCLKGVGGAPLAAPGADPRTNQYEGLRPARREHAPDAARPALRTDVGNVTTGPSPYSPTELAAARAAGTRVTDTLFRAACPRVAASRRDAAAGTWLYSFEWPSPVLGGAAHCVDIPFFFDVLDAPGVTEALGPVPPAELATAMHADLVGFVHGREPGWARASGVPGDPAREYGRPGAALVADTTGVFDPVVGAGVRAVSGVVEAC